MGFLCLKKIFITFIFASQSNACLLDTLSHLVHNLSADFLCICLYTINICCVFFFFTTDLLFLTYYGHLSETIFFMEKGSEILWQLMPGASIKNRNNTPLFLPHTWPERLSSPLRERGSLIRNSISNTDSHCRLHTVLGNPLEVLFTSRPWTTFIGTFQLLPLNKQTGLLAPVENARRGHQAARVPKTHKWGPLSRPWLWCCGSSSGSPAKQPALLFLSAPPSLTLGAAWYAASIYST